jgi:transketolase
MRATLSSLLTRRAQADSRTLLLTGDHGYALFDEFRRNCPAQYINCGVAEQNMVGVAAGLAKAGFRPIVYGLAAFVPIRVLEQIKIDVCLEDLPVMFLGDGAGFVYSTLGSSHQCFEDVGALRPMPNIALYSPADRTELAWCFGQATASSSASYLRLGKADLGDVHEGGFAPSAADAFYPVIAQGQDSLCLATGSMVKPAKDVIATHALGWDLSSVFRLKDISLDGLLSLCRGYSRVFTIEEHAVQGGLGSIVAEALAGKLTADVRRIGIEDRFSGECGSYAHLLKYHGLDPASLLAALR